MSSRTGIALLVLLGFDMSPTFHIAFVFGKGGRKGMTAGSICDKIQILSGCGMENSSSGVAKHRISPRDAAATTRPRTAAPLRLG